MWNLKLEHVQESNGHKTLQVKSYKYNRSLIVLNIEKQYTTITF